MVPRNITGVHVYTQSSSDYYQVPGIYYNDVIHRNVKTRQQCVLLIVHWYIVLAHIRQVRSPEVHDLQQQIPRSGSGSL